MNIETILLAVAPAFLIISILFYRKFEGLKDNPYFWLILIISCLFTMKFALFLNNTLSEKSVLSLSSYENHKLLLMSFCGIGFNEEFAKLLPLLFSLFLFKKLRSFSDVFLAVLFIGCFFAVFENLYVPLYHKYLSSLVIRALLATPAHISFACLMAPFVYLSIRPIHHKSVPNLYSGVFFFVVQFFIASLFVLWFIQEGIKINSVKHLSWYEYLIKLSGLILMALIVLEASLLLFNFKVYKKLFILNYRLGMLILAIVLPALLHGLHDYGLSRFYGQHKAMFQICLLITYTTIITITFFAIQSKQSYHKHTMKVKTDEM